jgi:hypothetical protein
MRIRNVVSRADRLRRVSAEASRRHGYGRLAAAARARRLRARGGFEYDEALTAGLLDPAIDERDALGYVSEFDTTRVLDRLNPAPLADLTAEKAIFYRHFAAAGIAVPELYGIVGRAGGWSARSGRPLVPGDVAGLLAHETPLDFVVKPSGGHHGLGVRVLRHEGGELVDLEGVRTTPEALAGELLGDPEFDLHVVQERLRNHPDLAAVFAAPALQTVRLTTFVAASGEVQVLHGCLKIASGGGNIDNFRGGATGNVLVEIDMPTGRLLRPWAPDGGAPPDVEGRRLPDWEEAVALAYRAAALLLPQRTMGFDVGLTPDGPVIVEANRGYDPFPSARFGAVVRAIARATTDGRTAEVEAAPGTAQPGLRSSR